MKQRAALMTQFFGIVFLFLATAASAAPVTIAGGDLDPARMHADVYLTTPVSEEPPPGPACAVAKTYVDYIRAGKYADMATLFTIDAALMEPTRQNIRGGADIAKFYQKTIGAFKPEIVAVFYLGNETDCMVELAMRSSIDGNPRFHLASVDHFTVDSSGKIIRMIAFARPSDNAIKLPRAKE